MGVSHDVTFESQHHLETSVPGVLMTRAHHRSIKPMNVDSSFFFLFLFLFFSIFQQASILSLYIIADLRHLILYSISNMEGPIMLLCCILLGKGKVALLANVRNHFSAQR